MSFIFTEWLPVLLCLTEDLFSLPARPGELERKGTRVNMVPIVPLQPGQKLPRDNSPRKKLEDLV